MKWKDYDPPYKRYLYVHYSPCQVKGNEDDPKYFGYIIEYMDKTMPNKFQETGWTGTGFDKDALRFKYYKCRCAAVRQQKKIAKQRNIPIQLTHYEIHEIRNNENNSKPSNKKGE